MFEKEKLCQIAGAENVLCGELLSGHTTFRIGGRASYFVTPGFIEDFVETVAYVRQEHVPYFIMGNGSNLLAHDTGYDGVVIATHSPNRALSPVEDKTQMDRCLILRQQNAERKRFANYENRESKEKTLVFAGSGIMLSVLAKQAALAGLEGLAFAGGIPGTLGGAVAMNAGAYGGEIKDCILGAMVLRPDGTMRYYKREALDLGYRTSCVQTDGLIVLWALFALETGDTEEILDTMRKMNRRRKEKQPLQYASAGSTFKRPEGYFAGKLIEEAGLKGYRVGDVMVSEKHCGFVVNVGQGTGDEARQVIAHVQRTVQERFGVWLETEVKWIE